MEPKTNLCPEHPGNQKDSFCSECKKIYCMQCLKLDKVHRRIVKLLSEQLLDSYEF